MSSKEVIRPVTPALGLIVTETASGIGYAVNADRLMVANRYDVDSFIP